MISTIGGFVKCYLVGVFGTAKGRDGPKQTQIGSVGHSQTTNNSETKVGKIVLGYERSLPLKYFIRQQFMLILWTIFDVFIITCSI